MRPRQRFSYAPESTLFELAAAYSFGIAKNHP
jgi:prophage maintenance system killer protein